MSFDPSGPSPYVNGEFVNATQASVSIFDHGGKGCNHRGGVHPLASLGYPFAAQAAAGRAFGGVAALNRARAPR